MQQKPHKKGNLAERLEAKTGTSSSQLAYPEKLKAIEFFSGIGAFRTVALELEIDVIRAFDQSEDANRVYFVNHGDEVCNRNLDTISAEEIPQADFWWLSPPCKPFTRRGKQADLRDPRAGALVNIIELLARKLPDYFALENVLGFENSQAEEFLLSKLQELNYQSKQIRICPTQFGIPMQRPRVFYLASRRASLPEFRHPQARELLPIEQFLCKQFDAELELDKQIQEKYFESLNIIEASNRQSKSICFTSGYGKSLKASGSYLLEENGRVRRFAPEEILRLLGFPSNFHFPVDMPRSTRWRLAGNTIELQTLKAALQLLCSVRPEIMAS